MSKFYNAEQIKNLNSDIVANFKHIFPIESHFKTEHEGVSRLVMLDRYSQKDRDLKTLKVGDVVVVVVRDDPKFPSRGIGTVKSIDRANSRVAVKLEEEFYGQLNDEKEIESGIIVRSMIYVEKPLELFYEQIAKRVGHALSAVEKTPEDQKRFGEVFSQELADLNIIPAGRVLYGAGSETQVTYFNCFVMPFIRDSRGGISEHRKEVMEIMSRGGGVGSNGSTLRPRGALAKGVGGKSSGSVSWLNDIANLTNLVEQGGSRRGAQMIMLADWHPDIINFIISKMQNPLILEWLSKNSKDHEIVEAAKSKLKFVPLSTKERNLYQEIVEKEMFFSKSVVDQARAKLHDGGQYEVVNPEFLSGANISVTLTKEFMTAIEKDQDFALRYPDLENYTKAEKAYYDEHWHEVGDVREWEKLGYKVKTYRTIKARVLWDLVCFCATYSAEPGIFFIDNANDMTNAKAYNQKVVATNPCGEQPLAPYSVCNLAAINLANFVDKKTHKVDYEKKSQF